MARPYVALVSESRLDRSAFLNLSSQITGRNHAREVDRQRHRSVQAEDIVIVSDFCGEPLGGSVFHLGFLIGGESEEIADIVQRTSTVGMPHINADVDHRTARAVLVTGTVRQWGLLTTVTCAKHEPYHSREVFTQIYHILGERGLHSVFDGVRRQNQPDGTILLISKA